MKQGKINWRSFTGVFMGYSLVIMIITGIVLYIAPAGRIAHWSKWKFLGFTKTEWQALHTLFSFIWSGFAIYHVILNWKALINYMRRKSKEVLKLRKEFTYATIFTVLIFAGTYFEIPPFSSVMDLGEYVTDSWANETNEPPVPHAELQTLAEFSKTINMPLRKIVAMLKENNITVKDSSKTIEKIASANKITPSKIYLLLKSEGKTEQSKYSRGSGFGRKLLSEILNENNLTWEEGIARLKSKGVIVKNDDKLRSIAEENDLTPLEIIEALGLK